jgi:hypothetical protein
MTTPHVALPIRTPESLRATAAYLLQASNGADSYRGPVMYGTADEINKAADEIERLRRCISDCSSFTLEQRTAETLDAERYRYLRNAAAAEEDGPSVVSGLGDLFDYHWGAEVDEVVDAAIARWKARGCPK